MLATKEKTTNDRTKTYNVRLINKKKGLDQTVQVRGDEYIVEAAREQGVDLSYSCSAGLCTTCTAKLIRGDVDHDHIFLKKKEIDAGFLLLCKSFPVSDCVIETDQEEALMDL